MKRVFLIISIAVSAALTSCNKITDVEDYEGNVSITIIPTDDIYCIRFVIEGSGPFSIDWGDGTVEKGKLVPWDILLVRHCYANRRPWRIITIRGDITFLYLLDDLRFQFGGI